MLLLGLARANFGTTQVATGTEAANAHPTLRGGSALDSKVRLVA